MGNTHAMMSWSGGKNSAMAMYLAKQQSIRIVTLLSHITKPQSTALGSRVPQDLIELQAMQMGLPLQHVYSDQDPHSSEVERQWNDVLQPFNEIGFKDLVLGDRELIHVVNDPYRFRPLTPWNAIYPLQDMTAKHFIQQFLGAGFKAIVTAINTAKLSKDYVGRPFDIHFISELPSEIAIDGSDDSFHTFVYDGPIFKSPIPIEVGEAYEDLLPFNTSICYAPLSAASS